MTDGENMTPNADELTQQIVDLTAQIEVEKARAMRALADLNNYKRRVEEQKKIWGQMATEGFLVSTLNALQILLKARETTEDSDIKMAVEQYKKALESAGLEAIVPEIGEALNTDKHEVLMTAEGEAGTIVAVLEPGWMLQGSVITPAKVSAAAA